MVDLIKSSKLDDKALEHAKEIQLKMRTSVVTAVTSAFGFIIALYWKDIIVQSVDKIILSMNLKQDGFTIKIIAAVIVTLICASAIYFVSKWGAKK